MAPLLDRTLGRPPDSWVITAASKAGESPNLAAASSISPECWL